MHNLAIDLKNPRPRKTKRQTFWASVRSQPYAVFSNRIGRILGGRPGRNAQLASSSGAGFVASYSSQHLGDTSSAFSIVETVFRNVERWLVCDHIERLVGSGLLVVERQFDKVQGFWEIPALLSSMANTISKKGVVAAVRVA